MKKSVNGQLPILFPFETNERAQSNLEAAMEILENWAKLIQSILDPLTPGGYSKEPNFSDGLAKKARQDNLEIRSILYSAVLEEDITNSNFQFIKILQRKITHVLNTAIELIEKPEMEILFADVTEKWARYFKETFSFLIDVFRHQIDREENLPLYYFREIVSRMQFGINKIIELSDVAFNDNEMCKIISEYFSDTTLNGLRESNFNSLNFDSELVKHLAAFQKNKTVQSLQELFYMLNFNCQEYIQYELNRLSNLIAAIEIPREKINALEADQKTIIQFRQMKDVACLPFMPSVKEQVNLWIAEEIKFLEKKITATVTVNALQTDEKIQTTLSVAKLAVIIKLLVTDRIIINRNIAPALRTISKIFTTLKADEISFGSLETKYHAPDKNVITNVRDMLHKWIKLIDKL